MLFSNLCKVGRSFRNLTFQASIVILRFNPVLWRARMAERDPIDVIREQLNKTEGLANLHADHEAFVQWQGETQAVLEKVFSPKSIHCQSFIALRFREVSVKAFASPEIDKINAGRYRRDLETAKNILQGAIKELTLDRTLFKKIQTTPKSVEVSLKGEYFISPSTPSPDMLQAIESALEGSGLKAIYNEEIQKKGGGLTSRIDQIKRSRFGIYDLSGPDSTHALLELGAAIGLGREIFVLHKKGTPLPEVLKSFDRIEYEHPSELAEKLKKRIKV